MARNENYTSSNLKLSGRVFCLQSTKAEVFQATHKNTPRSVMDK